ncbi:unnamed protein product [Boreogadus saida]
MELHSEGSLKVSRKRLRGGLPGARSALTEHSLNATGGNEPAADHLAGAQRDLWPPRLTRRGRAHVAAVHVVHPAGLLRDLSGWVAVVGRLVRHQAHFLTATFPRRSM